jgi:hypothetical protein
MNGFNRQFSCKLSDSKIVNSAKIRLSDVIFSVFIREDD